MNWWIWLHGVATGAGLLAVIVDQVRNRELKRSAGVPWRVTDRQA